jgi:hypothetical protein
MALPAMALAAADHFFFALKTAIQFLAARPRGLEWGIRSRPGAKPKTKANQLLNDHEATGTRGTGLLREARHESGAVDAYDTEYLLNIGSRGRALVRLTAQLAVVVLFLCLAAANMYVRATWSEPEDGVLWRATPDGVVVALGRT